ncbi:MAG TPA: DUF885 domain-containing protein [Gemmatimonadales bacterium]|nr:DUF885 domain-containing protein [Gemmatimonadales bacterium]
MSFRDLERSFFDLYWHLDPVAATQAGVVGHDDRYGRYGSTGLAPHLAALKSISSALEQTDVKDLEEEIDRTALLNEIRVMLRRFEKIKPQATNPEFWLSHLLGGLHHLLLAADRTPAEKATAAIGRLEDIPAFLDDVRATLEEPVRVFVETAIRMTEGGRLLIQEVAATLAAQAPAQAAHLRAAAEEASKALWKFDSNLERWLEMGSEQFAIGEDQFNFLLHYQHALRDTAPELWRYGLRLKEEVERDLVALATRLDGRPWPELVEKLRADHPSPAQLVDAYSAEMQRARDFVARRKLAPIPKAPLGVIPTPAFMRPVIPYAAYDSPGAYSRDRTGWFYVTVPDSRLPTEQQERILRDHCRYELAATALHEGYPGHHLQLVIAKEQQSHVRKNLWTPLTVEGWALYCEDMMGEEGFYASDQELFFQRVHLLWRAMRILLDVGLHTRGMTREQAVDQMVNELHVERSNADAEVRRYCAWPAYQLCYAVGRRELLRLRDDFRRAKGKSFTLRAFHDAVLPYGGLPVALIRWGLGLGE